MKKSQSDQNEEITPKSLYKYQKFDKYGVTNLINHQIRFSKPGVFNDPFEFNTNFIIVGRTNKCIKAVFNAYRRN